jgi:hypothetical protein
MSYQNIPLQAGIPFRMDIAGRLLLVDSVGVAGAVDVALVRGGTPGAKMPARMPGFRMVGDFDGVILTAPVDTTVGLFLSFDDVNLGTNKLEISNSLDNPVKVLFGGTVAPVLGSTKTTNTDAEAVPVKQKIGAVFTTQAEKLVVIVDNAPAVINAGAVQLLINDATYKRLRVKNASAVARVALGGAAMTMANAAIILEPGDTWTEDDAAGAAWYAVSDVAGADVRVMGVK